MSKNFDIKKLTVIQICNYIAAVNKLVDEKLIKFNPNKAAVIFNYDKASIFLEEQNIELKQRIDKATDYIKEFSWYYAKDDGTKGFVIEEEKEETFVNELLGILKGE